MIKTKRELEIINLRIDLREIKHIMETKPTIMCSEYVELSLSKEEIIKQLMSLKYDPQY